MDVLDDVGMSAAPTAPTAPTVPIDHDRCDGKGCPQRAYLWATVNGTVLAYCCHHGTEYFDRLIMAGQITLDMRHALHES